MSPSKLEFSRGLRNNPTKAEEQLWSKIRLRQINNLTFVRQKVILGWIVDFYCPTKRLAIELDGPIHNFAGQKEKDILRDKALLRSGIRTIRFNNSDVFYRMEDVVNQIRVATR